VQLAAALFAPAAGLFLQGASDKALVHPCPSAAALQPDWPRYSTLAGRVVGEWQGCWLSALLYSCLIS
jgi:hypothetical protein